MRLQRKLSSTILILAVSLATASAAVVTYSGEDIMPTTTSAHPLSAAAAANFAAAEGTLGTASPDHILWKCKPAL